jgi:hypothetical protein
VVPAFVQVVAPDNSHVEVEQVVVVAEGNIVEVVVDQGRRKVYVPSGNEDMGFQWDMVSPVVVSRKTFVSVQDNSETAPRS